MSDWLLPLRKALDEMSTSVDIFIRDDDTGWATKQLFELLNLCQKLEVPIDLAAIPTEMNSALADNLMTQMYISNGSIGIHQHGYSHLNHETEGRKYEFGQSRDAVQQFNDILNGQNILKSFFDVQLDPFFTPPWNRCTQDTLVALECAQIILLSRDNTAKPLPCVGAYELPVTFDWLKKKNGEHLNKSILAEILAGQLSQQDTIGIMLHHEMMDETNRVDFIELIRCLQQSPSIQFNSMRSLIAKNVSNA